MPFQNLQDCSLGIKKQNSALGCQVKWVPHHHCMAHPQIVDGRDSIQTWRVVANILNKQSWAVYNGWSSSL